MDQKKIIEAHEFGKFAEELTAQEYIKNNYVILERNWRLGKTEIDIIAQKENVIVFIEVKARNGKDLSPLEAITHDKRRRMTRAADCYIRNAKGEYEYRFDFATVSGTRQKYEFEILEDAFLAADFF